MTLPNPLAQTGGLPIALADRGHRVYTIAPRYDQYHDAWDTSVHVNIGDDSVGFFHTQDKGAGTYITASHRHAYLPAGSVR